MKIEDFQKLFADHIKRTISIPSKKWSKEKEVEFDNIPLETIIDDPYFLGQKDDLYPAHREDILEIFGRKMAGEDLRLFLDSEAIGSGKTHKAAVMLYLTIFKNIIKCDFQEHYPLIGKDYGLAFMCTSRDLERAKDTTFEKVLPLFLNSPFFQEYFPPDVTMTQIKEMKRKPDRLMFPNRVLLFTASGFLGELGAIGYDLIYSCIDEINFLQEVEKSSRKTSREDGMFDAAEELVNTCMTRIPSRFLIGGKLPPFSMVHAMSARRGREDFLDRKQKAWKNDPQVIIRNRKIWEAKPAKWKGSQVWSGHTFEYDTESNSICNFGDAVAKWEAQFGIKITHTEVVEESEVVEE